MIDKLYIVNELYIINELYIVDELHMVDELYIIDELYVIDELYIEPFDRAINSLKSRHRLPDYVSISLATLRQTRLNRRAYSTQLTRILRHQIYRQPVSRYIWLAVSASLRGVIYIRILSRAIKQAPYGKR
jgi:hypothetical protein